ncbi:bifunctional 2-polyprenyl-6-hydroxyphenol methylase/3-demethylubiquinol 3-O-methyltransferase UbiG [Wenzhouxiangella limi]|uniref:Ubiquinone biosynthesis O-methyltransferase n=1 Tax=Wenzhouxiangella limi TaxID=2707351 RepID=A0A845UT25_9GAMM|nr:bifunctional 2-polyprenyl-6-hydroxyphenol methylase/3-demethylubiquinol 3-O-methyltransferase UbiG [Wenzhouxiangella limi]NDY94697.1 bifunctional 2-polyprenyl-6-hydroxyphenol methylase/3-demethylubiquinol 3-O-methyltransferase UbiG [Wenzhouxiangella limi]
MSSEAGTTDRNLDPQEAEKFDQLAARWWDPAGDSRPLHDLNGPRTEYIAARARLQDARVVDVGCGGGLLCESLALAGASVTGIDAAEKPLGVARLHAAESALDIDYRQITAEELAQAEAESFDVVCCLEMLEHVPDPASTVAACAALCRPGGQLFFSTINRSPLAWTLAIVGAEYVLGLLPKGTHRYDRLIRPGELAGAVRASGLDVRDISGMDYNPFSRTVRIGGPPRVNYLVHAHKPD